MIGSRWTTLSIGMLFEMLGGFMYAWGVYSQEIQNSLGLSVTEINNVSAIFDAGVYLALLGGLVVDKCGGRTAVICGAVMQFAGYFGAYAVTAFNLSSDSTTNTSILCVCFFIAGQGGGWLDSSAVATNVRNFAKDQSLIIGLLKSFFGISASILAVIYLTFFSTSSHTSAPTLAPTAAPLAPTLAPTTTNFTATSLTPTPSPHILPTHESVTVLLVLAIFSVALVVPFAPLFKSDRGPKLLSGERFKVFWGLRLVAILALFVGTVSYLCGNDSPIYVDTDVRYVFVAIIGVASFSLLPLMSCKCKSKENLMTVRLFQDESAVDVATALLENEADEMVAYEECSVRMLLARLNFWLVWCTHFFVTGAGLMAINNINKIAAAVGGSPAVYVAVIGVCNCMGRMGAGFVSSQYTKYINNPSLFAITSFVMMSSQVVLMVADKNLLYLGCVLCGFSYGACWCLCPSITAELFGYKNMGVNYNILGLAPATAGYTFNAAIASAVYKAHQNSDGTCVGHDCYRLTFLICACCCFVGGVLQLVVGRRTVDFYKFLNNVDKKHITNGQNSYSG